MRAAAAIAAAMHCMMYSHHPHAWTTPVDVRTAGCAMAMFRRQTAAANSTIRKGSAVDPTRWRGASMPAVGLGRVGWPPVGFGARQQARRGPQAYCTVTALRIRAKSAYVCRVSLNKTKKTLCLRAQRSTATAQQADSRSHAVIQSAAIDVLRPGRWCPRP